MLNCAYLTSKICNVCLTAGGGRQSFFLTPITRSPAQKPAHKDLEPKWPKTSHLGSRPLMLWLLTAPVRAQQFHHHSTKNQTAE
ncbi:hypothetical protein F9B82_08640 [Lacticaseibacillus casei]|nr:hypothetical protein F9B82_08640 [Lacticaseibacillus casei]